jgi:hypothetical protein
MERQQVLMMYVLNAEMLKTENCANCDITISGVTDVGNIVKYFVDG